MSQLEEVTLLNNLKAGINQQLEKFETILRDKSELFKDIDELGISLFNSYSQFKKLRKKLNSDKLKNDDQTIGASVMTLDEGDEQKIQCYMSYTEETIQLAKDFKLDISRVQEFLLDLFGEKLYNTVSMKLSSKYQKKKMNEP